MELTPERLKAVKLYCRIDAEDTEEDSLLTALYWAAVGYLGEAGITEPEMGTPRRAQYDLCVNYLVLDGYDRREVTLTGTAMIENPAFRRLLTQLKLTEAAETEG